MLKIENAEVLGWEHAIRGMRNPKNSWGKSDSGLCHKDLCRDCITCIHKGTEYNACAAHFDVGPITVTGLRVQPSMTISLRHTRYG